MDNKVSMNVKIDRDIYLQVKAINKIEADLPISKIIEDALKVYIRGYNYPFEKLENIIFHPIDKLCPICKKQIILTEGNFACSDINCKLGHGVKEYMKGVVL
ncbi:MAG: hypothetical protein A2Z35_06025 [Actinobacteria bacterium RBG_19FT_COMBO_36_27]|nr:MAG: hypothetical protein A2Z35_06025 [Actinobacteria bacterium RBG_19FT_COMBO_36_27]